MISLSKWKPTARELFQPFPLLVAYAFLSGVSLTLSRIALVLTLAVSFRTAWKTRTFVSPRAVSAVFWVGAVFFVWIALITLFGPFPEPGTGKLDKMLWYAGIPLCMVLAREPGRRRRLVEALTLGAALLALWVCLLNPLGAAHDLWQGVKPSYAKALIDRGSLSDGQRLMVGLVGAVALGFHANGRSRKTWWSLAILLAAAEILVLKRGSWFASLAVLFCMAWPRIGWKKMLMSVGAVLCLLLALPPARTRLAALSNELSPRGGRMIMWREVAPGMLRDHPWGRGFRAQTYERMKAYSPRVEPDRNHLHSNLVETAVAAGWPGLGLYLAWIGTILGYGLRLRAAERRELPPETRSATIALAMVIALLLNGLIEYNFADAKIVVVYGVLIGILGVKTVRPAGRTTA